MNTPKPFVILGIGNCLLTDDGVGVHAVRCLQPDPPPNTTPVDVGTDFLSAIPFLEQARAVLVIDAMDAGGLPGTIYRCRSESLAGPTQRHSLHELGLLAIREFLDVSRRPPIHVLGVQPVRLDYGLSLSAEVAAVLPEVVALARATIAELASTLITESILSAKTYTSLTIPPSNP